MVVLDIGGTHIRIGHLDTASPHQAQEEIATDALRRGEPVGFLVDVIREYVQKRSIALRVVVLGVPFTPDKQRQTALSSPNIPNLEGIPLVRELERKLRCPVVLERDINLLLLGEVHVGAARGYSDVFGMFIGTGIGGSMLVNGQPYRGSTGAAIELGHIPIRGEGRQCVCGNLDCLEAYACGHTLQALAADNGIDIANIFVDGYQRPRVAQILDEFTRDIAFALATSVNLFHPRLALVGGGIPLMHGFPKSQFEDRFYAHLRRPVPATSVSFAWAELGSKASLYGACALPGVAR